MYLQGVYEVLPFWTKLRRALDLPDPLSRRLSVLSDEFIFEPSYYVVASWSARVWQEFAGGVVVVTIRVIVSIR